MKTNRNILPILAFFALALSSCAREREVRPAPDYEFSFTVTPVDGEYNAQKDGVETPASFEVLITSGEITDYDLEYRLDGGDLHRMHKLWPGVRREIPVYLSKPGSCELYCTLARADGRSGKKAVRERVYMRGPDVNQVSCRLAKTVSAGSKRNVPLDEEGTEPLYRWDTCKVDISVLPSTEYELTAFSSDPSVLEVISFDQKTDKNYGTASLSFTARKEGEASLTIQVLNGSQVFPFKKDFSVTEDLAVLDYAVKLSSAHIVCNDATDSWKAYHDAEIRVEFSAINPGVGHNLTLSIDGIKVCEKDEWFISGGRFSTSLFWDEIAATEGLVLSEGEHNFTFSVARCDGMDEDAFTGKFVVEDTGLGIQKAEFKYQDTTGEWQMYRPGVVMVDFSLVNMESLHKVTFSIDGTNVYTEEHVRFSEGIAPGETATTYQFSLDWDATAALVALTEGEHSFKLLVEREDGHSKAAYDGKFTVTGGFPGPEITTFECSPSIWRYEDIQVYIELNVPFTEETAAIILRIDGDEFFSANMSCEAGTIILNKVFSTRNDAMLREDTEEEGKHKLTLWTRYENHPEVSSSKEIEFDVVFPSIELELPAQMQVDIYDDWVDALIYFKAICHGVDDLHYKVNLFFEDELFDQFNIIGNTSDYSSERYLPENKLKNLSDGNHLMNIRADLYEYYSGQYLSSTVHTILIVSRHIY